MERRDFLQGFAALLATAGAGMAATGCATSQTAAKAPVDLSGILQWLDNTQASILKTQVDTTKLAASGKLTPRTHALIDLSKRIINGLLVVGIYNDLPASMKRDPQMQQYLKAQVPEFDKATLQLMGYLESLTPTQRAEIKADLQVNQTVAELQQMVHQEAGKHNVPSTRTRQFDQLFGQAAWRFKHQDPGAYIDEVLSKADRTLARHGLSKSRRQALSKAALADLYKPPAARKSAATASPRGRKVAQSPEPHDYRDEKRDNTTATVGGAMVGIGLGLGLFGMLMAVGSGGISGIAGLFWVGMVTGVTIGGLVLIIGIIVAIVGAARGW